MEGPDTIHGAGPESRDHLWLGWCGVEGSDERWMMYNYIMYVDRNGPCKSRGSIISWIWKEYCSGMRWV